MFVRRFCFAAVLIGFALLAGATPAFAHARLIASDPAEGGTLATPPTSVELTFNQPVTLAQTPIEVVGPEGATWTVHPASVSGAVVQAHVVPQGPAGEYTLTYRVLSEDGDEVDGTVTFTLTVATTATATTPTTTETTSTTSTTSTAPTPEPAAAESSDGVPGWAWIAGAVVLAAALVVALRLRRG